MRSPQTCSYPLERFEQPVDKCRYLNSFIVDYISRYQLFDDVERYTKIIGLFMRFCTPPNVSFRGLDAVCMFTTLSFFIDDQSDKGNNRYLERYQEIITGKRSPVTQSENALSELLDFAQQLSESYRASADSFRQHLLGYITAQQWERECVNHSQGGFSIEDYRQYRPDAIALFPYLALLKLSENIDESRFFPLQKSQLLFLEQLAAKIAYLDNDICSWESERTDPTALNLIKIIKESSDLSWRDSFEEVLRLRNAAVELYSHNRDCARQVESVLKPAALESTTPVLNQYLSLLECSVTGNLKAMSCLKLGQLRYQPSVSSLAMTAAL
ncbi:MAG: terpene synthase family protein [Cyanobacteria bacterium P01_D01_bin.1]